MANWILAIIGVLTMLGSTLAYMRSQGRSEVKLAGRVDALEDSITRLENHHRQHFAANQAGAQAVAALDQKVVDHIRHDDDRFEESRNMLREMRDDIKELLGRK